MKRLVLSHINSPLLPIIGLLTFVALFVAVVAWMFRKGADKHYKSMENLPFNEGGQS